MTTAENVLEAVETIKKVCATYEYCEGCPFCMEDGGCAWTELTPINMEVNTRCL